MKAIAGILGFVVLLGAVGWWKVYAYGDCKHVGHSRAYCIVHFMSN